MVARFIRDSLEYWREENHIDGFRFDLIGIFEYNTVKDWGIYLNNKYPNKKIILYGEPWEAAPGPNIDDKVHLGKLSYLTNAHIGTFNNQFRYAIKDYSDDDSKGYIFNEVFEDRAAWDIERQKLQYCF